MNGNEICVSLDSLAIDGEGDSGRINPEPGDRVSMTVEGTMQRADNGKAYVQIETANGEPLPVQQDAQDNPEQPGEDPTMDKEEAAFESMLRKDQGQGGYL